MHNGTFFMILHYLGLYHCALSILSILGKLRCWDSFGVGPVLGLGQFWDGPVLGLGQFWDGPVLAGPVLAGPVLGMGQFWVWASFVWASFGPASYGGQVMSLDTKSLQMLIAM